MMEFLFDDASLEKKTKDRPKKYKPIPLDKYIIMCEKELIIDFLIKFAPFSFAPRRITNSWDKGNYEVFVRFTDFIDTELSNTIRIDNDSNCCAAVENYLKNIKCDFARWDYYVCYNQKTGYSNYGWVRINEHRQVKMIFKINKDIKKQIIDDYNLNIGV